MSNGSCPDGSIDDVAEPKEALTRDLLHTGAFEQMFLKEAPTLRLLSASEREASLTSTLAERPDGPIWVFAYGSLIWNPVIATVERRIARVEGWHRSFCLSATAGRGSIAAPGLVLALDEGGYCEGLAYRLDDTTALAELSILWRREMVAGSYLPRWLRMYDRAGSPFGFGLAFTASPEHPSYAGNLDRETIVCRLATASGGLGTAASYLMMTRDELRKHGIPDPEIESLARLVEAVSGKG